MISKILIGSIVAACLWSTASQARNEYLNDGFRTCQYGNLDLSIETREDEYDYRHNNLSNNYDGDNEMNSLRMTFRKYLGVSKRDCDEVNQIQKDNAYLRQELEMLKVCNRYSGRKLPPQFAHVTIKCQGLEQSTGPEERDTAKTSAYWDELKQEWIKDNPHRPIYDRGDKLLFGEGTKANGPGAPVKMGPQPKKNPPLEMPPLNYELPEPSSSR